ncbi:hypothetical protein KAS08_02365 [Candidatus Pacearchaeota archaeon]|nr:hypothetical protein [Candidatus Pacearchaeota archaeon]
MKEVIFLIFFFLLIGFVSAGDSDSDGVLNNEDECPNTEGKQIIYGCSCNQILEIKPGKDKVNSCSKGILKIFEKKIGWAKSYTKPIGCSIENLDLCNANECLEVGIWYNETCISSCEDDIFMCEDGSQVIRNESLGCDFNVCSSINDTNQTGNNTNTTVMCYNSLDCGISSYVGDYFCQDDNVYQNFQNYTCINPGTTSSFCESPVIALPVNKSNEICAAGFTVYVDGNYNTSEDGFGLTKFKLIQNAIDNVVNNNIINVKAGIYNENIIITKNITLIGSGYEETIIDGGNRGLTLVKALIPSGLSSTLKGITLANGGNKGVHGGGIYIEGNVNLEDCRITGNTATNGGGIFIETGNVSIINCLIDKNYATNYGGALTLESRSHTNLIFSSNTVVENTGYWNTPGVHLSSGYDSAIIKNIIFWGNYRVRNSAPIINVASTYSNLEEFDPLFINPNDDNYNLQLNSLAIDSGDPLDSVPIGGGLRIDMGAFEYII